MKRKLKVVRTVIVVTGQVLFIDEKIMIFIELPELAVNDIKVFVAEEVGNLINVFLFFQQTHRGQQI